LLSRWDKCLANACATESIYGVTVNVPVLVAVPPVVVTTILPDFAPVGTSAVSLESDLTVNIVALTPPKVALLVCVSSVPVIVTDVPAIPLVGVKPVTCGITLKIRLLLSVWDGVVTSTRPVFAPQWPNTLRSGSPEQSSTNKPHLLKRLLK
jgi:hypothetical protein